MFIDTAMNSNIFRAYIERVLALESRTGDIVIIDNLSSHKVPGVAEAITAKSAQLRYLPPYSPDLNPIEQFFSKLKAVLRRVGARTLSALWRSIGDALKHVADTETRAFMQNAGYRFQSAYSRSKRAGSTGVPLVIRARLWMKSLDMFRQSIAINRPARK